MKSYNTLNLILSILQISAIITLLLISIIPINVSMASNIPEKQQIEFIAEFQARGPDTNTTAIEEGLLKSGYDTLKERYQEILDLCSPTLKDKFTSLLKTSPTKEECNEIMIILYATCQKLIEAKYMIEGLYGTTLSNSPLDTFVREQCSNERLLNYDYPKGRPLDFNSVNYDLLKDFYDKYNLKPLSSNQSIN